jgi:hypothetical protein
MNGRELITASMRELKRVITVAMRELDRLKVIQEFIGSCLRWSPPAHFRPGAESQHSRQRATGALPVLHPSPTRIDRASQWQMRVWTT